MAGQLGKRVSVWLNASDIDKVEWLQKNLAAHIGLELSVSAVIRAALLEAHSKAHTSGRVVMDAPEPQLAHTPIDPETGLPAIDSPF